MKFFLLLAALLMVSGEAGMAAELSFSATGENFIQEAPPEVTPAPLLRNARAKGEIIKLFIERTRDWVRVRGEKLCDFDMSELPVWDNSSGVHGWGSKELARCESTVKGHPVNVRLDGYMMLSPARDSGISKGYSFLLRTLELGEEWKEVLTPSATSVFTRDLTLETLGFSVGNAYFYPGNSDEPVTEEMFAASFEVVDRAQ